MVLTAICLWLRKKTMSSDVYVKEINPKENPPNSQFFFCCPMSSPAIPIVHHTYRNIVPFERKTKHLTALFLTTKAPKTTFPDGHRRQGSAGTQTNGSRSRTGTPTYDNSGEREGPQRRAGVVRGWLKFLTRAESLLWIRNKSSVGYFRTLGDLPMKK